MAKEIRIPRGDSRVLSFLALNADTGESVDLTNYEVLFSTEDFDKTSENHPLEVQKDTNDGGDPVINVKLTTDETNPTRQILHYDLKIYTENGIMITGSTGDLIITDE